MSLERMLPPGNGNYGTLTINGRSYTAALGSYCDMPSFDARVAEANGWTKGDVPGNADVTANRPSAPTNNMYVGKTFLDTTLGYLIVWDGVLWRNPDSGAAV
jgi:hypothetical protein